MPCHTTSVRILLITLTATLALSKRDRRFQRDTSPYRFDRLWEKFAEKWFPQASAVPILGKGEVDHYFWYAGLLHVDVESLLLYDFELEAAGLSAIDPKYREDPKDLQDLPVELQRQIFGYVLGDTGLHSWTSINKALERARERNEIPVNTKSGNFAYWEDMPFDPATNGRTGVLRTCREFYCQGSFVLYHDMTIDFNLSNDFDHSCSLYATDWFCKSKRFQSTSKTVGREACLCNYFPFHKIKAVHVNLYWPHVWPDHCFRRMKDTLMSLSCILQPFRLRDLEVNFYDLSYFDLKNPPEIVWRTLSTHHKDAEEMLLRLDEEDPSNPYRRYLGASLGWDGDDWAATSHWPIRLRDTQASYAKEKKSIFDLILDPEDRPVFFWASRDHLASNLSTSLALLQNQMNDAKNKKDSHSEVWGPRWTPTSDSGKYHWDSDPDWKFLEPAQIFLEILASIRARDCKINLTTIQNSAAPRAAASSVTRCWDSVTGKRRDQLSHLRDLLSSKSFTFDSNPSKLVLTLEDIKNLRDGGCVRGFELQTVLQNLSLIASDSE